MQKKFDSFFCPSLVVFCSASPCDVCLRSRRSVSFAFARIAFAHRGCSYLKLLCKNLIAKRRPFLRFLSPSMDRVMGLFARRFPIRRTRVRFTCCQVCHIAFTAKGSLLSVESGLFSLRPFCRCVFHAFLQRFTPTHAICRTFSIPAPFVGFSPSEFDSL